jgi:hypothetical protein
MNYAFNKIKFNRQVANFIGKEGRKKYSKNRCFSQQISGKGSEKGPEKDPFPSWKFIAFISGIGLYHQYVNQIKNE